MKHAWREIFFRDSLNVFKIKFKLAIKLRLLNSGCINTVDSFIHERFELIFDVIF